MIDITSNGVKFAVLQGQLLAGDIDRLAFLEGTVAPSPLSEQSADRGWFDYADDYDGEHTSALRHHR